MNKFQRFGIGMAVLFGLHALIMPTCWAGGGFEWDGGGAQAGNGRVGLLEFRARVAYSGLGKYVDQSLVEISDRLSPDELALLSGIRNQLHFERSRGQRLHFAYADEQPQKFVDNQTYYAVWTEDRPGSDLWVNADFLVNQLSDDEKVQGVELAGILLHGLAQHQSTDKSLIDRTVHDFMKALGYEY